MADPHVTKSGNWKSDKVRCAPGYFPLSFKGKLGRKLIRAYADQTGDRVLARSLYSALADAGTPSGGS
jgi:hypothetical protein